MNYFNIFIILCISAIVSVSGCSQENIPGESVEISNPTNPIYCGLDYNLDSLIRSTYKFLIKMEDLYEVQKEMIKFLKGLGDIYPHELKGAFIVILEKLKTYEDHPYESRAFLYLDIISWLESKIENKAVSEIIRNKYLSRLSKQEVKKQKK